MKKILSSFFLSFLILAPSFSIYAAKPCECGTQAGGSITSYSVGDGEGCCSGTVVGDIGVITYYTPDEGTTYTITGTTQIPAATAQADCCTHT
ncbi:MAG: hypothetical protein KA165_00150 [Saprospiraceae bacterium]|nr:hypothetical protein [Saprospiraceae bacterium]